MDLLLKINISLPFKEPIPVFAVLMLVILLAPVLFKKIRVPQIIGLILSGLIIGPTGLKIIDRDGSIELLSTVGLLYIMFLAGIEINLHDFKKQRNQSFVFGFFSFLIPFATGTLLGMYVFNYPTISSLLIGAIFSSHTLVTYPIISRFGLSGLRSVNIAIGGTIFTDTLSLLILSVIASIAREGISFFFWIRLTLTVIVFGTAVLLGVPVLARWFFKKSSDRISQYIFVISILFLTSFISELLEIEPVIAAFLTGLAFNRLIPHTSGLMNRVEFMGNALFIPVFLISVGMLIDLSLLFSGWHMFLTATLIITFAIISKFFAAFSIQKIFNLSRLERKMIFGLSNSRAAAALAAAIIGFNIIISYQSGETGKLLGEEVLNATILLILFTCGLSSFEVERAAREMVLFVEEKVPDLTKEFPDKILVPVSNPDTVESLIEFASIMKNSGNDPVYILNVVDKYEDEKALSDSRKLMEKAEKAIHTLNISGVPLTRYDLNPVLGILHTIKENQVSDLVIGIYGKTSFMESFFGNINENIIRRANISVFISKFVQPLSTVNKIIVFVPPKAEYEPGFSKWLQKLHNISRMTGKNIFFYSGAGTVKHIELFMKNHTDSVTYKINPFSDWGNISLMKKIITKNDLITMISARPKSISHFPLLDNLPAFLTRYFSENNIILIYPEQYDTVQDLTIRDLGGTLTGQLSQETGFFNKMNRGFKKVFKRDR